MEINATNVVSLYVEDIKRLNPNECLNDNLIDLQLKLIVSDLPEEQKKKILVMNSQFYPQQTGFFPPAPFKKKNIFDFDFIIVPIHKSDHWSLCVIVRPLACICVCTTSSNQPCLKCASCPNTNADQPCFLIMDSYPGSHWGKTMEITFKDFLFRELSKGDHCKYGINPFNDMLSVKCGMPKQPNSTDCGMYVAKFVEEFVKKLPFSSTASGITNKFDDTFNGDLFTQEDVKNARRGFKKRLEELKAQWDTIHIMSDSDADSDSDVVVVSVKKNNFVDLVDC
jgi:Ulp1 family protease